MRVFVPTTDKDKVKALFSRLVSFKILYAYASWDKPGYCVCDTRQMVGNIDPDDFTF